MNRISTSTIVCTVILALIFILSLVLRITLPWSHVFAGDWVKFTDNDAYFYVRLLDNLAQHFPRMLTFDPYFVFPGGIDLSHSSLFFVYLMGFFAWLFGAGAPSQHMVDLVGVYFPAVAGALLVFPVFFIGRTVFNRWAGLVAALFIALMPGEFLIRTLLGNTDSHVVEIFFTTLFMLFLALAVSRGQSLKLLPLRDIDWRSAALPLVYSVLAGLSLGLYLLSWQGALLFVLISFVWLIAQFISDHLRGKPTDYLAVVGFITYVVALLLILPSGSDIMTRASLSVAALCAPALYLLSWLMRRLKIKPAHYPAVVAALGIAAFSALFIVSPALPRSMFDTVTGFFSWSSNTLTAEMQPLLIQQGSFTLVLVWGNYTAASVLALVGFGFAIYRVARKGDPELMLLIIWSLLILLAALAMRRFAYYLAIDVAILAGYSGWLMLRLFGLKEATAAAKEPVTVKSRAKRKHDARREASSQRAGSPALLTLGAIIILLITIYPNTGPLPGGDRPFFDVASRAPYPPGDAWCEALDWMRTHTPEPFADNNVYHALDNTTVTGKFPEYPPDAYSVICWWDFGYWVSRIGHRPPYSNPGSAQRGEQYFFTAPDESSAARWSNNWGQKYVIVDDYTVDRASGFRTIVSATQEPTGKYYEIYYRLQKDKLVPTLLYYPEYYRTMAVRLYCFDAKKYTPSETAVVSWEDRTASDGRSYKEATGLKTFRGYEDALAFINVQKDGNWRIVGKDPNVSPVPLEDLRGYRLAYGTDRKAKVGTADMPAVKIFEYARGALPVTGDWNGDKKWEVGLWLPQSRFFLLDSNGDGVWNPDKGDLKLGPFGGLADIPVMGDWNGDGKTEVGTWSPADLCFYLDYNGDGQWDPAKGDLKMGPVGSYYGDKPLSGDWAGDGHCGLGLWGIWNVYIDGVYFYLLPGNAGPWQEGVNMIKIGPFSNFLNMPLSGDWNGDGRSEVGMWDADSRMFMLDLIGRTGPDPGKDFIKMGPFGNSSDTPVAGDWSGKGKSHVGTWNPVDRCFYLDINGDGKWEADVDLKLGPFRE